MDIQTIQPERVPHHKLASEHRNMNDAEFESLKLDIQENGQILPVILYKGKLVDGRHRQRALIELGIHDMKYITLPGNISLAEVRNKVIGTEMRRSDTTAQKAIRAWLWLMEQSDSTQSDAAIKFGVGQRYVSEAKTLYDKIGKEMVMKLYEQGYLYIGEKKHTQIKTILKAIASKHREPENNFDVPESVKQTIDLMNSLASTDQLHLVAYIEKVAKNIRTTKD